jgi:hypothetical protein
MKKEKGTWSVERTNCKLLPPPASTATKAQLTAWYTCSSLEDSMVRHSGDNCMEHLGETINEYLQHTPSQLAHSQILRVELSRLQVPVADIAQNVSII